MCVRSRWGQNRRTEIELGNYKLQRIDSGLGEKNVLQEYEQEYEVR